MSETDIVELSDDLPVELWDFWNNLPVLNELDDETFNKILGPVPRCDIADILVTGIRQKHPITKEIKTRRALSAKEIMDRVNDILESREEDQIKKSNLYFHLQKLEDKGLIQVVLQVPTGKRFTTYYGRGAKVFTTLTSDLVNTEMEDILNDPEFAVFLKSINPDVDQKNIDETLKLSNTKNIYRSYAYMVEWLSKHEVALRSVNLDVRKIFDLINLLERYDNTTFNGFLGLRDLLGFEKV